MPQTSCRRQSAVAVAGPLYWKFLYSVVAFQRAHYDFHIKHKAVRDTPTIQLASNITTIYFEAALRVAEFCGDSHSAGDEPMEGR